MARSNIQVQKEMKGLLFRRPDTEQNLHWARIANPNAKTGWGEVCSPDEMRYIHLAGLQLVTQSGAVVTDEMIRGIVDQYTRSASEELQYQILPVSVKHRPMRPGEVREIDPEDIWEDAYDYRPFDQANFFTVLLRRRPLVSISKWILATPFSDQEILNLLDGADIMYSTGLLRNTFARPHAFAAGRLPLRAGRYWGGGMEKRRLPGSYYVDYVAGHQAAAQVDEGLRLVISKLAAIHILSGFGDSVTSGLAGFSISLSSISESVNTTMSATSAMFGARILQLTNEIKGWMETNAARYRRPGIAVL